ncbi:DAK2 domain-containing protein [Oceanirhabdus sp. W0125-5]|uniref:DAK2 domain-containing protein n=1 Tax=Oceanirhabdus sp. W0125-5 TaxID=2999116 RepID=UPI0022F2D50F|nr:DAK2 domain-containing protein [Oceanirhabdus sp. W0125-5]WBW94791.1 DAK2 domain-containing protein [Oceanirhabdus sp. W0125-5]
MQKISIDGANFYYMLMNASNKLEQEKEYVNSLNVFPVPDGDTGTNMSLTFKAAAQEVSGMKNEPISEIAKKFSRGALMGARGNSGVILSQIFRGLAKGLENLHYASSGDIANAIMEGANYAYKAVMRPTEGTILTVIREAGEFAIACEEEEIDILLEKVCNHAEDILNKTPDMLPALKEAKVVDAGGMGMLILLKGMLEAVKYDVTDELKDVDVKEYKFEARAAEAEQEFGYCTEFIVLTENYDLDTLKTQLSEIGDSIVAVGMEDFVKIHVHTLEPGKALNIGTALGQLTKIKIENMSEQHQHTLEMESSQSSDVALDENIETKKFGFIAVARGEGLTNIFKDLNVDRVIEGGQTMNPSTQDLIDRIEKINAETIFILPNNKNIMMAAEQAVHLSEKNIIVVPSKTIPEGIAALSIFDENSSAEENLESMIETIDNVSTGSVTYAVKDTESDGREIKANDVLGIVNGKIEIIGNDNLEVCCDIIDAMVDDFSELITIYYGEDCDKDAVEEMIEELEEKYPDMDIECYEGKQPLYYFIVSVE